jgi:trehalose 6-phosphate synthase/phosphatase
MASAIDIPAILEAYRHAEKRILFLDYDGTLVPFCDVPGESVMVDNVRDLLSDLCMFHGNSLYITSGRDAEFLTGQFDSIPVGLIAEHGYRIRKPRGTWITPDDAGMEWKKDAKVFFRDFTRLYPGSFIEEKASTLAFHYRNATQGPEHDAVSFFRKRFMEFRVHHPELGLLEGEMVSEIKMLRFDKGKSAGSILGRDNFGFILAAGDDVTDEYLFDELGEGAFTIKVGLHQTKARFFIPTQADFVEFLRRLAEVTPR